jgi:DnaK suppressor protein
MARKDALLRLHERLTAIRDSLRKKISDDIEGPLVSPSGGDVGDAANDGEQSELNSQLVALESRELAQIERAIELIREGRYGTCEVCSTKIPIARLKALPYTLLCVDCQREQEELGHDELDGDADWESVFEHEGRMNDRELTLGDIDVE